jgi:predicted butyrate kinase (DUF1464 family)
MTLEDGRVADQARFGADQLAADASAPVTWLEQRGPFALVAGPSGYGLPLVAGRDCTQEHRMLMRLVRADDERAAGVAGFSPLVEAFCASPLPIVFLPGVIHLDTVPPHRKHNRIDLGTADKLAVAALAIEQCSARSLCVVELGTAFTACLAVADGQVVDGLGGTCGPSGWRSCGAWDGEAAYLAGALTKGDLFAGGSAELLVEGVTRAAAGMLALHRCEVVVLSGRLLETEPGVCAEVEKALARLAKVERLASLTGAWVKHAAQGAALIADGLAGGGWSTRVGRLRLRQAAGTALDWVRHPRRLTVADLR